ncbi:hypothetical protein GTA09_27965 [Rhodococcus hoagii]|nr:hypothetical protein [Prescottella equi]
MAKRLKTQHALAGQLWGTGDTAARLVAILISRPKAYSAAELDAMLRDARVPKVHGWLVSNVVKKNPHVEELRTAWLADPDPRRRRRRMGAHQRSCREIAGGLDLSGLLDTIETLMKDAPSACSGDERVPGHHRHPPPRTPGAGDRHRRETRSPEGLSDAAELHLALRAGLDRRDGAPKEPK